MIWFEKSRIPEGQWPFLNTVRVGLHEIEVKLAEPVDLTEGTGTLLITGCMRAYRHAVLHRVLDLAKATVASWNSGSPIGAIVCSRALIETIATFHSFLTRAEAAAATGEWEMIGKLVDAYAFSTMSGPSKRGRTQEHPPRIKKIVTDFIKAAEPGKEQFWEQICDTAHPNGRRMMSFAGDLREGRYVPHAASEKEPELFVAVFNCLYSCCWLDASELDFDVLLEQIRSGRRELPADHELVVKRSLIDSTVKRVAAAVSRVSPGPPKRLPTRRSR